MFQAISDKCKDFIQANRPLTDDDDGSSSTADKKQKPDAEIIKKPEASRESGKQQPEASEGGSST